MKCSLMLNYFFLSDQMSVLLIWNFCNQQCFVNQLVNARYGQYLIFLWSVRTSVFSRTKFPFLAFWKMMLLVRNLYLEKWEVYTFLDSFIPLSFTVGVCFIYLKQCWSVLSYSSELSSFVSSHVKLAQQLHVQVPQDDVMTQVEHERRCCEFWHVCTKSFWFFFLETY